MLLTSKEANTMFRYEPETGFLYWRIRPGQSVMVGDRVGHLGEQGYISVQINCKAYLVHRVIWLMIYGHWPKEIDHINHLRHDNRIENIRQVTRTEQQKNRRINANNVSGVTGVHWSNKSSAWAARINIKSKKKHLGYFSDWFEAVCARKSAEVIYGYHPNHGRAAQ